MVQCFILNINSETLILFLKEIGGNHAKYYYQIT